MVVATYNVAPYLNAFCDSILAQTAGLDALEVIFVNDGSTDGSGEIAQGWAERHPRLFRTLVQENQGVAAARNAGLAVATGDWICFPDPDDFLSPGYLAAMLAEITRPHRRPLLAVAAPLIFYHDTTDSYTDDHPLRHRFGRRTRRFDSTDTGHVLLPHTSATCMRRADITDLGLTFDGKIQPSFEDAHFIIRLILHRPRRTVSFVTGPAYYYRKRAAGGSLIDGVTRDRNWYGPHLQSAYLSLLTEAKALRGRIPRFIQASVLFSLLAKLRHLTGPDYDPQLLNLAEQQQFLDGLDDIMARIETRTLRNRRIPGLHAWQRAALLLRYKGIRPARPWITLTDQGLDATTGAARIRLRWIIPGDLPDQVEVLRNGQPDATGYLREARMLFKETYAQVITQDITLADDQSLQVRLNGRALHLFAEIPSRLLGQRRWLGWRLRGVRWQRLTLNSP